MNEARRTIAEENPASLASDGKQRRFEAEVKQQEHKGTLLNPSDMEAVASAGAGSTENIEENPIARSASDRTQSRFEADVKQRDATASAASDRSEVPNRVTFKEFWALCMAHYRLAFAELGLLLLMLGVGYAVVWVLFLR